MSLPRRPQGHRLERLEQLLLEELTSIFEDEVSDPRLACVRVLAVTLSADYRHARVHCVLAGEGVRSDVERALARVNGFLRRRLSEAIEVKRLPEIHFAIDAEKIVS